MHGSAYTAADIKRYLRGEMSPAEMHALEKAALDDPFLADAIEGMQMSVGNFDADIKHLQRDLALRKKKKTPATPLWKAAAVLICLLTAIAIAIVLNNKQPQSEDKTLAKVERTEDTPIVKSGDAEGDLSQLPPPEKKQPRTSKTVAPTTSPAREIIAKEEEVTPAPLSEEALSIADNVQEPTGQTDSNRISSALQGKVAGVQVDKNPTLDEVVVVGYSARKKVREKKNESVVPEGGWEDFYQYINDSKTIDTSASLVRGITVISFRIDEDGRPMDFKVRKSLSPTHDQEAIRLLRNGPDWKILKGTKRKVRLEIKF